MHLCSVNSGSSCFFWTMGLLKSNFQVVLGDRCQFFSQFAGGPAGSIHFGRTRIINDSPGSPISLPACRRAMAPVSWNSLDVIMARVTALPVQPVAPATHTRIVIIHDPFSPFGQKRDDEGRWLHTILPLLQDTTSVPAS